MTNNMKNADWKAVLQKFREWKNSDLEGAEAMYKAYKHPSQDKVRGFYFYRQELALCRIVGYPGTQVYSVGGLVFIEGRKFFRTYIGSSHGVRMLEAPYDLLWNCK